MLNYRNINIAFVLLLFILIVIAQYVELPWLFYILLAVLYLLLLFYGSYCIGSGFYLKAICKASPNTKKIALTFDDGPATYTQEVLKILKQYHVKATFFCIGKNIEQSKETLQDIDSAGHTICNHSYSHSVSFDFWNTEKVLLDLQRTHQLVQQITGKNMRWFRPPFGVTNPNIAKATRRMNYQTIGWSIRSMDTVAKDAPALLQRICRKVHPGAIILLHDICLITVDVLPLLIEFLKQENYEIVPLDNLLNLNPYAN